MDADRRLVKVNCPECGNKALVTKSPLEIRPVRHYQCTKCKIRFVHNPEEKH